MTAARPRDHQALMHPVVVVLTAGTIRAAGRGKGAFLMNFFVWILVLPKEEIQWFILTPRLSHIS